MLLKRATVEHLVETQALTRAATTSQPERDAAVLGGIKKQNLYQLTSFQLKFLPICMMLRD